MAEFGSYGDETFLFTSESVGEGHPDKLCDMVSDAVLDAHLAKDPDAKIACETITKTGLVMCAGEISSNAEIDYQKVIRDTIAKIGYDNCEKGFDSRTCNVIVAIEQQCHEIANAAHVGKTEEDLAAGDQGIMFGYATDETEECMPLTVVLAHALNRKLAECRRNRTIPYLRPDTKTQITCEYKEKSGAMFPQRVHTVVVSTQHDPDITNDQIAKDVYEKVIRTVIPEKYLDDDTIYHINPSGSFVMGGPMGDAGLTGRKIIVDTYGGWGAHGGGACSGKDYTKVDRCSSYACRWVAKSLVKAGICKRCLVQVSYSIGISEPLSISVFDYGTSKYSPEQLVQIVRANFDMKPGKIIKALDLRRPIYSKTSCYGHFGQPDFTWEKPKPLTIPF